MPRIRYRRFLVRTYLFFGIVAPLCAVLLLFGALYPEERLGHTLRIAIMHSSMLWIAISFVAMMIISNIVRCQACSSLMLIRGFPFRKPQRWQQRRWYVDLDTATCPVCQAGFSENQ